MPKHQTPGLPAREWEAFFLAAKVLIERINDAKSSHSKTVIMGQFLSPLVGSEVLIQVNGQVGKAKLCVVEGRSKEKRYFFEVRWIDTEAKEDASMQPPTAGREPQSSRRGSETGSPPEPKPKSAKGLARPKKKKSTAPAKQVNQEKQRTKPRTTGNNEKW